MLVTTLSRNARSWLTRISVPGQLDELFLEQLERLDIQVVGRLVEDQHVRRTREETRQQQAVALAARQRLTGDCARSFENRKSCRYAFTWRVRPLAVTVSLPSPIVSKTVRSGSSCSRCWS